jgi:hypothetical protein
MARGWESKAVEAQQEEAARGRPARRSLSDADRSILDRRRSLELARAKAASDLTRASAPAHRNMLEQTLHAIEAQLAELNSQ